MDSAAFENLRGLRLLLVEDDADTLKWMHSILEIYFDSIHTANDGSEGLSRFKQEQIDMLITDIRMVGIDGLSMIRTLKRERPKLPVIITTAHSGAGFLQEIAEYQNMIFLKKPIDLDEILIAANNFFRQEPKERAYLFEKARYCVTIEGRELLLTKNECRLFEILDRKFPSVATTEEIEAFVWQGCPPRNEALRMLVTALRKKIAPLKLENLKGIGYKLGT